ncbi:MAG: hypothetical protein IT371_21450 [Deltaproteobacteria bacterium]|nr:hypothetical protein [Deltaproteobacteria bacterium]
MRLVINRSHGHLRFMDFRVGNYEAKRDLLDQVARQEGLRKIFTLVEKQDSNGWRTMGFIREGVYPGFFRTADAYIMSRIYDEESLPLAMTALKSAGEDLRFQGRKIGKPDGLRMEEIADEGARATVVQRLNGALRGVPFGRDKAPELVLHVKARTGESWVCVEIDESFGTATIGFAPPPAADSTLILSAYAGNSLMGALKEREVNNAFGLTAAGDRWSNELYSGLGFKVMGRLAAHLRAPGGEYLHALLWHRRLAAPAVELPHPTHHSHHAHHSPHSSAI